MNFFGGGGEAGDVEGVAVVAVGLSPGPDAPDTEPVESGDRSVGTSRLSMKGSSLRD